MAYTVTQVSIGERVYDTLINNIVYNLQVPHGSQETGTYNLAGNAYTSAALIGDYVQSNSNVSVPLSCTVDTSISVSLFTSISTNHLKPGGFQVYGHTTGSGSNAHAEGKWTLQF